MIWILEADLAAGGTRGHVSRAVVHKCGRRGVGAGHRQQQRQKNHPAAPADRKRRAGQRGGVLAGEPLRRVRDSFRPTCCG